MEITSRDVLIVVDVQNDFCPGGALAVPGGDEIVPTVNKLITHFAAAGAGVVLTQDWHPAGHASFASTNNAEPFSVLTLPSGATQVMWPDHCRQGTKGAQFHPGLTTNPAQVIVRKGMNPQVDSYSAFADNDQKQTTGLAAWLRAKGYLRCFFVGLALDYCVAYSAIDAVGERFAAYVLEDATRAIADDSTEQAKINFGRRGVSLLQSNDVLG